ncbi:MAG: type II secretion system F family protein [Nanoarchaeota archaeon]
MYRLVTRLIPARIRHHYEKLYFYAKVKVDEDTFLGFFITNTLLVSIALAFLLRFLFGFNLFYASLISFVVLQVGLYFSLALKAESIAKFVESILPDALQLMTSNLRAGMTIDSALLLSARPEFGPLTDEINSIGKKVALGGDVAESLNDMSKHFQSLRLKKAVALIVTGLRSGGELSELLSQTADNLRKETFLDQKIRTNVLMYVIFIFVAIGIGAPMLFGLSSFLVGILNENLAKIELPETSPIPITLSQVSISSSFVQFFAIFSLITTSIFGSFILGLISKGSEKSGAKYIPLLIILSLSVFFLSRYLVGQLLGGLFGI